jgi:hypothetical protein
MTLGDVPESTNTEKYKNAQIVLLFRPTAMPRLVLIQVP